MAYTTTAQTLVKDALKLIGALAQGEDPTPGEYDDGIARLNELVDTWSAQRLTQQVVVRTVFDLVANQASYTVGTSANVNVARPEFLDTVRLLYTAFSPTVETGLDPLTDQEWEALSIKGMTAAQPTAWHYTATMPTGTLYLWPIPDNATNDAVLYAPTALVQFATPTTSYTLAPAYARALRTNLAVTLAPEFARPLDPLILQMAHDALGYLKQLNVPMADLAIDRALLHGPGRWNIQVGP